MRQIKENMGDCMSTVVENWCPCPRKTARKFCRNTYQMLMRRLRKWRKKKAAGRGRSVTEAQRGHYADSSQARRTRDEDILWEQREEKGGVTWADILDEEEEVEVEGETAERQEREENRREMIEQQQEEQEEQQEEEKQAEATRRAPRGGKATAAAREVPRD